jgi:hypothetical protein
MGSVVGFSYRLTGSKDRRIFYMASRTYLPMLVFLAHRIRVYCAKYDTTIRKNMSTEVQALYDVLLGALDALLAAVEIEKGD